MVGWGLAFGAVAALHELTAVRAQYVDGIKMV